MIWFFLMGMVGGAVGMMMLAHWWVHTHVERVTPEEMVKTLRDAGKLDDNEDDKKGGDSHE